MEAEIPTLSLLFEQLGLPSEQADIEHFVNKHRLAPGESLEEAAFWDEGQRQFLRECLKEDAEWAIVYDELNALLTRE